MRSLSEKTKKRIQWISLGLAIVTMIYLSLSFSIQYKTGKQPNLNKTSSLLINKGSKKKPLLKVTIEELAFRSTPGVQYDNRIGSLKKGQVLTLLDKEDNWYKVLSPGKRTGYVSAKPGYTKRIK